MFTRGSLRGVRLPWDDWVIHFLISGAVCGCEGTSVYPILVFSVSDHLCIFPCSVFSIKLPFLFSPHYYCIFLLSLYHYNESREYKINIKNSFKTECVAVLSDATHQCEPPKKSVTRRPLHFSNIHPASYVQLIFQTFIFPGHTRLHCNAHARCTQICFVWYRGTLRCLPKPTRQFNFFPNSFQEKFFSWRFLLCSHHYMWLYLKTWWLPRKEEQNSVITIREHTSNAYQQKINRFM